MARPLRDAAQGYLILFDHVYTRGEHVIIAGREGIVQETLTNVARHAGATHVAITMETTGGNLRLTVHDNGKGVKEEEIGAPGSFGIMGMKERALILGGEVTLATSREGGTIVTLALPPDGARGLRPAETLTGRNA